MSSIQQEYERISYPHYVHPLTDPARLAALGRILGLNVAKPDSARILDIGCGSGTSLLAMAERLPDSQFLGIDFAATEIMAARALVAEAGLENVEFEQADLLTWEPDGEKYDYIIAYGLFSWVPDEVKDRLLQVCSECLAPDGMACISYMTYPGCKQPEALRDLLRLRTESCHAPEEKVERAHEVLHFLDRAYERMPNWPHTAHLRDEVQKIRRKENHFLLLDELGVERDPCYLLQFANWAAEHQLRYVGESELYMMFLENLPADSARELAAMRLDRLETEQMIDYVVNRSFRCSLLTGVSNGDIPSLNAKALQQLCLRPHLQSVSERPNDLSSGLFITQSGVEVTLRSIPLVAFARALADRPDSYTTFERLCSAAEGIAGRPFNEVEVSRLCKDLLSLYVSRQIDVSAVPFAPPDILPPMPRLTPLNRAFAMSQAMVATAHHDACRIGPAEQKLCQLLDGTRTLTEIRSSRAGEDLGARLECFLDGLRIKGALPVTTDESATLS